AKMPKVNQSSLGGQWTMFRDFFSRYRRTLSQLHQIKSGDFVYAVSDYWFDVLPAVRAPARKKMMVLHMEAPTLGQILRRSRPDVDPARLASFHYWASQEYSLRRFIRSRASTLHTFYLHPAMRPRLLKLGCPQEALNYVSYGLEVNQTETVPEPQRVY